MAGGLRDKDPGWLRRRDGGIQRLLAAGHLAPVGWLHRKDGGNKGC